MADEIRPSSGVALLVGLLLLGVSCNGAGAADTAMLLRVHSKAAIDCVVVDVTPATGKAESARIPVTDWHRVFKGQVVRVAAYPNDGLKGKLVAHAKGLLQLGSGKPCDGTEVASAKAVDVAFVVGKTQSYDLTLTPEGTDADGDGWAANLDCNDGDPTIYPGAKEICDDGIDQSCAGAPDVGCACGQNTATRPCYPLGLDSPTLKHPGATCKAGTQTCNGVWGQCVGAVLPTTEVCDGIDTDCDGLPDPANCPCNDGDTRSCYTGPPAAAGIGQCTLGTQTCTGGAWGTCTGDVMPQPETCNGKDDDCDGIVDNPNELPTQPCEKTQGVCALAHKPCSGGSAACTDADYAAASGGAYQKKETLCDGIDNDCNGKIDEGCSCDPATQPTSSCYPYGLGMGDASVGVGPCHAGTRSCKPDGTWGPCTGAVIPITEACDGTDDDCNGTVDDVSWVGAPCVATGAIGLCRSGSFVCQPGVGTDGKVCQPGQPVNPDPVCDGVDANCNSTATPANDDRDAPCDPGKLCCAGGCVDIQNDLTNCGDCYNVCPNNGGECKTPACSSGSCGYANKSNGTPCTDDGNACTSDACRGGTCSHPPLADGTGCNQNGGAVCQSGHCANACFITGLFSSPGSLDPVNECKSCQPGTDPYGWSNVTNGTACTSDGNPCTTDACSGGSCAHPPVGTGTPCGSGKVCNGTSCQSGCYIGGSFYADGTARPGNTCQVCNPAQSTTSWTSVANSTACNDGDACTQTDTCQNGLCQGSNPVTCTALDQCHDAGTCDPATGQCSNPNKAQGTPCNDGNACTLNETCQNGSCTPASNVQCTALDQCHDIGTCDPATGQCSNPAKPNGTTCNDGNACTLNDQCTNGGCGGTQKTCTALDQCHNAGTCDPASGLCSNPAKADNTTCNDGNTCTSNDVCTSGKCGGTPYTCTPNACQTSSTCNGGGGCTVVNVSDGTSCGNGCACFGGTLTETNCHDGQDNDGDGYTDCRDHPDCDGMPCGGGSQVCHSNGGCW